jgi:hypothetical protein
MQTRKARVAANAIFSVESKSVSKILKSAIQADVTAPKSTI